MDEKVFDFQQKIDNYEVELLEKRKAYSMIGDMLADLEVKVRRTSLEYMHAHPEAKKIALEKIELLSAVTKEQRADYYTLIGLRLRKEIAEKLIESLHSSTTAVQSQMRWWRETYYGAKTK